MTLAGGGAESATSLEGNDFVEMIEFDPTPRAIIDENLYVLWTNYASKLFCHQSQSVGLRDGKIAILGGERVAGGFPDLVGKATIPFVYCVGGESGVGCMIRVDPLRSDALRRFALTIYAPRPSHPLHDASLNELFRLTPAEGQVLREMTNGRTAQEIAKATGVSVDTIRSHIRSLYAKLSVNSREAMLSRVVSFRF